MTADPRTAIRDRALALGFDAVGFAAPETGGAADGLAGYLERGYHGDMGWMETTHERRRAPAALWPEARSIVAVAMNYGPDEDPLLLQSHPDRGIVSAYARGSDYHDVMKKRLRQLARWMAESWHCEVKLFVDTAPVMEKPVAERAGLGWQGKHTNLVSRGFGSWIFLGEVFTTLDIAADAPGTDHCGACRRCLDICPTDAFPAPYRLDARRCISYLTIEHKGHIPREFRRPMGNRIYGCDDCQLVCPWNRFAQYTAEADFAPRHELDAAALADLLAWDEDAFLRRTEGSAIRRTGYLGWLRNIAVALGNVAGAGEAAETTARAALESRREHPSELVREHVDWALKRLQGKGFGVRNE